MVIVFQVTFVLLILMLRKKFVLLTQTRSNLFFLNLILNIIIILVRIIRIIVGISIVL